MVSVGKDVLLEMAAKLEVLLYQFSLLTKEMKSLIQSAGIPHLLRI